MATERSVGVCGGGKDIRRARETNFYEGKEREKTRSDGRSRSKGDNTFPRNEVVSVG